MPHADTEVQLAKQPATALFAGQIAAPYPHLRPLPHWEKSGRQAGLSVRSSAALASRLRAAWERLNPALPPEAITAAVDGLTHDRSAMSLFSGRVNLKTN